MNLASHPSLDVVPDYPRAIYESLIRIERKLDNLSSANELPIAGKASMSPREAAAFLGIGRSRLYEMLRVGTIRSIRVGRKLLIPTDAIQKFLRVTS